MIDFENYERVTVKNVGNYTQIKNNVSTLDCLKRLAELEDRIEDGTLVFIDEPKALSCFYKQCLKNTTCSTCDWLHVDWHTFGECSNTVTRPPQNYIYVEE